MDCFCFKMDVLQWGKRLMSAVWQSHMSESRRFDEAAKGHFQAKEVLLYQVGDRDSRQPFRRGWQDKCQPLFLFVNVDVKRFNTKQYHRCKRTHLQHIGYTTTHRQLINTLLLLQNGFFAMRQETDERSVAEPHERKQTIWRSSKRPFSGKRGTAIPSGR